MGGVFSSIFPLIMLVTGADVEPSQTSVESSIWRPLVEKENQRDVSSSRVLAFNVLRDGKPIGTHVIKITPEAHGYSVGVDLRLRVTFGPITVFRYSHESREEWKDGQLISLKAKTRENGDEYSVLSVKSPAGLMARGEDGSVLLPSDILTTTYWNRVTVEKSQMLDTQSGKIVNYEVEGPVHDPQLNAEKFRLTGDLTLDLWYQDQEFIKMAFENAGALVEYEPMSGRGTGEQ